MRTSSVIKIINRFSALHREEIRKIMEKEELYFGQHPILWCLYERGPMTQIEIAHQLEVSAVSVSNSVKRLSNKGFISKESDSSDLRKSRICLTEKGEQAALNCRVGFAELDRRLFYKMSEDELTQIYLLFDQMIKNLEHGESNS